MNDNNDQSSRLVNDNNYMGSNSYLQDASSSNYNQESSNSLQEASQSNLFQLQYYSNYNQNSYFPYNQNQERSNQPHQAQDQYLNQSSPNGSYFSPPVNSQSQSANDNNKEGDQHSNPFDLGSILQQQISLISYQSQTVQNVHSHTDYIRQKSINEAKQNAVQKLISEGDHFNLLQLSIRRKFQFYRKQGYTSEEATNKILSKLMQKSSQHLLPHKMDPDLLLKLKKANITWEEYQKSLHLKSEIESLVEQKGMTSSEESSSHDWDLSPNTREKQHIELKYKNKITRVMDTFKERVEGQSSSGSCSSDEKHGKNPKKRKYKDYLQGLQPRSGGYKVPLGSHKKRHVQGALHQQNAKKRISKDFIIGQGGHFGIYEGDMIAKQRAVKRLKNEEDYHQS